MRGCTAARRVLSPRPGTRAYLSAALPGATSWVAGPVTSAPRHADVELREGDTILTERGSWESLG